MKDFPCDVYAWKASSFNHGTRRHYCPQLSIPAQASASASLDLIVFVCLKDPKKQQLRGSYHVTLIVPVFGANPYLAGIITCRRQQTRT